MQYNKIKDAKKGGVTIMWKQKIGISIANEYNIPIVDLVKMLKKSGLMQFLRFVK